MERAPVTEAAASTPLPVIAQVSRVVTAVVDRLTGDRVDFPLLVAWATVEGLKRHGIESRVMYGPAAWVEVLEDQSVVWAGCWDGNVHFWTATHLGEVVDLNTSVAYKKRPPLGAPSSRAMHSPPMLWSAEVPAFYRYQADGVAELELTDEKDRKRLDLVLAEVREKCDPAKLQGDDEQFPNEPILCPGRKLLDDSKGTFKHFDRAVGVRGIPKAPKLS
jgi:hypothetical protein